MMILTQLTSLASNSADASFGIRRVLLDCYYYAPNTSHLPTDAIDLCKEHSFPTSPVPFLLDLGLELAIQ